MDPRFARHALVPGWRQDALGAATVVVFGVGALGNEVARLLAMAGLGRLILCDPDVVSPSNLSRCVLFRPDDVGRLKVDAAAVALAGLAPGVEVVTRPRPLDVGVGLADIRDADLVVGCLDSNAARVQLSSRCAMVGAAWLDGGTSPWGGEVHHFVPGGACYGCLVGAAGRARQDDPISCGVHATAEEVGSSAPVSALVGAWAATMAVRLLSGMTLPATGIVIDTATVQEVPLTVRRQVDCPLHERIAPELVRRPGLSASARVADLLDTIAPDEDVMTWHPVAATRADDAAVGTVFLRRSSPQGVLSELGIPPREILPVIHRPTAHERHYIELVA